jgi:hypothetical protein
MHTLVGTRKRWTRNKKAGCWRETIQTTLRRESTGSERHWKRAGPFGFWQQQLELEKATFGDRDRPFGAAELHGRLGDGDRAYALLERAYAARMFGLLFLNVDPAWDVFRDDPRFRDLLLRIGFPSGSTARAKTDVHLAPDTLSPVARVIP